MAVTITYIGRLRVTLEQFWGMTLADNVHAMNASPYKLCKIKIDGRWFACDRQYQMGRPVYFARRIVIALNARELSLLS